MPHIGVLLVSPIQLLDLAPIDLLAMTAQSYFTACRLPSPLVAAALPDASLTISYIAASGAGSTASTTAHLNLAVTHGLADAAVAPGAVDILLIPGPPPGMRPAEEVLEFVRAHVRAGVDLLTVCSGVFVAGYAGVLDGCRATGTRGVEDLLAKEFPEVEWVDQRYVRDGRIWTSGGITNGMDMMAVYMQHRWPGTLSETVLAMAEVEPRPQAYTRGKAAWTGWFVWHIFRAWVRGLGGRKKTE